MSCRHVDGAEVALGFGADVPHLPGRPGRLQGGQHPVGGLRGPVGVGHARGLCGGAKSHRDHRGDGPAATKHRGGFLQPGGTLFGVRARFVFGVAGLQRCLLGQM
jgi:hypothetical protein